jgi:23S rRNA (cytosine1962-C5)-methyltransferase
MRSKSNWTDYTLLDATDGNRLEKWGNIILVRPDPQVIWKTCKKSNEWGNAHAIYHRSDKGGGYWDYKKHIQKQWNIRYKDLIFKVSPTGFKHTGLLPEQAVNWDVYEKIIERAGRPVNVLNLFGYTGGATLACAKAGASVCHVDSSKGMVAWGRENASLSSLADRPIRWIVDDCIKFVKREVRRKNKYDAIIMDPPSYGRGPNGEVWKFEDNIFELLNLCSQIMSEKPLFVAVNSYTTGISSAVMEYMLNILIKNKYGGTVMSDEIGLVVETTNLSLPCGNTAFWISEDI